MRLQSVAAGQDAEVLEHDGFEQRRHELIWRRAHLLQAVDVGLGENATLSGNFVELDPMVFLLGQLSRRNLQLGIDLVDDRAGPAGAFVVHGGNFFLAPGLLVVFEDNDLGVLAAKFDHRIDLRMKLFDGQRNRGNLLHKFRSDLVGDGPTARAGDEHAGVAPVNTHLGFHAFEELEGFFRLLGFMALVVLPQQLVRGSIDEYGLDCR